MARVKVDILGISKLKWSGICELNSDDYYIYNCGQKSLRRNGVAIIVKKKKRERERERDRNAVHSTGMQSQKRQNDLYSFPVQTIQFHGNPSLSPDM